jgi:hypothetical protein
MATIVTIGLFLADEREVRDTANPVPLDLAKLAASFP